MALKTLRHKTFNDNIAEQNSYLLAKDGEAFVIDPGFNGTALCAYLDDHGLALRAVLLTHGHFDHLRDLVSLAKTHRFTIHIHELDREALRDESRNYARAFNARFLVPDHLELITHKDTDTIMLLGETIRVIHTPGHTAGSVCYALGDTLFTGDTLFSDGVGRTDLFGGSASALRKSLARIVREFSRGTPICSGHGEAARLADVLTSNPDL